MSFCAIPFRDRGSAKRQKNGLVSSNRETAEEDYSGSPPSSPLIEFIRPNRLSSSPERQDVPGPSSDLGTTPLPRSLTNRVEVLLPQCHHGRNLFPQQARQECRRLLISPSLLTRIYLTRNPPAVSPPANRRWLFITFGRFAEFCQLHGLDWISRRGETIEKQIRTASIGLQGGRLLDVAWLYYGSLVQNLPQHRFFFFDDYSDEDVDAAIASPLQPPGRPQAGQPSPSPASSLSAIDDADLGSVMEDNSVDRMVVSAKRSHPSDSRPRQTKRRRTQPPLFKGQLAKKTRQPRINQVLERAKSAGSTARNLTTVSRRHAAAHMKPPRALRAPKPSDLSILDVVEPQAPNFIKIAARTARSRREPGKDKPFQEDHQLSNPRR